MTASRWWFGVLAVAALAVDPLAPAAVVKGSAVLLVALALAALAWQRLRLTGAGAAGLLLAGWQLASLAWSPSPDPVTVAPWLAGALLTLPLAALDRTDRRAQAGRFALAVALAMGAVAVWQRAQGMAAHGLQGNSNWAGIEIAVCLPLVWERRREGGALERRVALVALLVGAAGLFSSGSRTAWVALALALALMMRGRWRWALVAPFAVGLGHAAIAGDLASSWSGRLWIARVAGDVALSHVPLGCGVGAFSFAYLEAQGELLAELTPAEAAVRYSNAVHAHDDWLQLAAEGGPIALALLVAWVGAAFLPAWRSWRAGASSVLVAAVAALGDTALGLPAVAAVLAFVAADAPLLAHRRWDAALAGTALATAALLLPFTLRRHGSQRALHAALREDGMGRLAGLEQAARRDPLDGEALFSLGLALDEAGEIERANDALSRSSERFANLGTHVALGNLYLRHGQPNQAIAAYRAALRLHPGHFRASANLVEALRQARQLDAAAKELDRARALQPHHPKLAHIAERLRRDRIDAASR